MRPIKRTQWGIKQNGKLICDDRGWPMMYCDPTTAKNEARYWADAKAIRVKITIEEAGNGRTQKET